MKIVVLTAQTKKSGWLEELKQTYQKKINPFSPFIIESLKVEAGERDQAQQAVVKSDTAFLKKISLKDYVILFDETGQDLKNSEQFAKKLNSYLESGKSRLVFLIGGPYGFGALLRQRADASLRLSNLTMSHQIAVAVALEQIYRGFTILKNLPYHNAGSAG